MFERYTERARRVIFFARVEASQFGSNTIESEHMLLGLVRDDKSSIIALSGVSIDDLRQEIERRALIHEQKPESIDLLLSPECKSILKFAAQESEKLGHKHIGTEHLLLGILREEKCLAAVILREKGMNLVTIRSELAKGVVRMALQASDIEIPGDSPEEAMMLELKRIEGILVQVDGKFDRIIQRLDKIEERLG